jgi:hypothetical protein
MYVGPIRAHIASILGTSAISPSDCFVVSVAGDRRRPEPAERERTKFAQGSLSAPMRYSDRVGGSNETGKQRGLIAHEVAQSKAGQFSE